MSYLSVFTDTMKRVKKDKLTATNKVTQADKVTTTDKVTQADKVTLIHTDTMSIKMSDPDKVADKVADTDKVTDKLSDIDVSDRDSGDSCESVVKCTDTDVSSEEDMLFVQCGLNTASFYLKRLELGPSNYRGLCVLHDGAWFTPNQFQRVSGRQTAKDWKRSIKHHGRSLKSLLSAGLICLQPPHCRCEHCVSQINSSLKLYIDLNVLTFSFFYRCSCGFHVFCWYGFFIYC